MKLFALLTAVGVIGVLLGYAVRRWEIRVHLIKQWPPGYGRMPVRGSEVQDSSRHGVDYELLQQ